MTDEGTALTKQFNIFQLTFDNINGMINDPEKGLKHPETLMAIKVGMQNMFGIQLPSVVSKGVNGYFISNLIAKGVTGGKGLDDPETRNSVMGKVSGFMAGIESSFGLKQGTLTGFIDKLFGEANKELAEAPEQTIADAKAAEETLKAENKGKENQSVPAVDDKGGELPIEKQTKILEQRAAFMKAQAEYIKAQNELDVLAQAREAVKPIAGEAKTDGDDLGATPSATGVPKAEGHQSKEGGQQIGGTSKKRGGPPATETLVATNT